MLSLILGFITGLAGPISTIIGRITDLKIAQAQAASDTIRAEISLELEQVQSRKAVLLAEAGDRILRWTNGFIRAFAGISVISYLGKIFLWDKVIGAFYGCSGVSGDLDPACHIFNTDKLGDPTLNWVMVAVIGFYFLATTLGRRK